MKKVFYNIVLSGLFIAASLTANSVFAKTSFNSPDGDKKVKKETVKKEKKAEKVKDFSEDQDTIEAAELKTENSSEEMTHPNNPLNNLDCTKEGFDRE